MSKPNFDNLLKVLNRQVPDRPTLFEFFLNKPLYEQLAGPEIVAKDPNWEWISISPVPITAYLNAGYDYLTIYGSQMTFNQRQMDNDKATLSLNEGNYIYDRKSLEQFNWPDPDSYDYSRLEKAQAVLPEGIKLIIIGPGGVLENAINLVGFERLCMMLIDDPKLAEDIFAAIGSRLLRYYEICAPYDSVGALISNDDWGFKTQTMLSPADMRRFVFPWHKKIVQAIHAAGKPAILHSCGKLDEVMDDIIDDMKYDAKHSFEDNIEPIEKAYDRWGHRIALLGGIDMNFICTSQPEEIRKRCQAMLAKTKNKGGYALGTGNSVPEYVPDENYLAMIQTVTDTRK
jgi:uroporphyrinogen decarboxylase